MNDHNDKVKEAIAAPDAETKVVRRTIELAQSLKQSEERYKLLAENTADVIYKVDIETENVTYASPAVEKLIGYTPDEMLSLTARDILTPSSYAKQKQGLLSALASGERNSNILELDAVHKSGHTLRVEIHVTLLADDHGVPREILGVARDISNRKQAEKALRASEERHRFLAENMADIVWTIDLNFKTTYVSPSITKALGYTPEERMRQRPEEMLTPDSLAKAAKMLQEELFVETAPVSDKDRSITIEVEYYHKNGQTVWMENLIKAMRDDSGKLIGMYGSSRDITDRKQAEEALKQERDRLQAALAKIKQLSGLLPICASCKKIRDDKGYWNQIESYIARHSEADFSHSLCPECVAKLYPNL